MPASLVDSAEAQADEGDVVMGFEGRQRAGERLRRRRRQAGGEALRIDQQPVDELLWRQALELLERVDHACLFVEAAGGVAHLGDAVGEQQHGIARLELHLFGGIGVDLRLVLHSDRRGRERQRLLDARRAENERRRVTGAGEREGAGLDVEHGEDERHEAVLAKLVAQGVLHLA